MHTSRMTTLAVVAAAVAATCCFQSCKGLGGRAGRGQDADTLPPMDFCTAAFQDSAAIVDAAILQSIKADFPLPGEQGPAADSIRAWLTQTIPESCYPRLSDDQPLPLPRCTFRPGGEQAFVDTFGRHGMEVMTAALRDMAEDGFAVGYENDFDASVTLQTRDYITFEVTYSIFTGGAHGANIFSGTTFRRSDGSSMGWRLIDPARTPQLLALIRKGLCGYFAECAGQPVDEDQLTDYLLLWDDPDTPENELEAGLPLPQTEPWLTPEGVAFVYQQYEVAPYVAGQPTAIIPVEDIQDCLSPEGKALLGVE